MNTYISIVIINNKANVVVSPSVEIHTDAVAKLIRQGGKELTHEIIGHELNDVIIHKGQMNQHECELLDNEVNLKQTKSSVSVNGALHNIHADYAEIVAGVLGFIGQKGVTIEAALYILERSKEAVKKCTLLQDEYTS